MGSVSIVSIFKKFTDIDKLTGSSTSDIYVLVHSVDLSAL